MGKAFGKSVDSVITRIKVSLQRRLIQRIHCSFIADPLGGKPAGEVILSPFPQDSAEDTVLRKTEALAFIQYYHDGATSLAPADLLGPQIK